MTEYAFNRIEEGLNEILSFSRGETTLKTITPAEIAAKRAARQTLPAKIRTNLGLSQKEFAKKYHITLSRLQDWEQRRSEPDSLARAYLQVIERESEAVDRALATTKIK